MLHSSSWRTQPVSCSWSVLALFSASWLASSCARFFGAIFSLTVFNAFLKVADQSNWYSMRLDLPVSGRSKKNHTRNPWASLKRAWSVLRNPAGKRLSSRIRIPLWNSLLSDGIGCVDVDCMLMSLNGIALKFLNSRMPPTRCPLF